MQRGQGGMTSPVRPGPNAYDQGGASKPAVNTQPFNNQRLAEQNQLQNIGSAAPQAGANAQGQAITKVETRTIIANSALVAIGLYADESGYIHQNRAARRAMTTTTGTNTAAIRSTSLWMGALPICASSTRVMILASKVSSDGRVVRMKIVPSRTRVPAETLSPSAFRTG